MKYQAKIFVAVGKLIIKKILQQFPIDITEL